MHWASAIDEAGTQAIRAQLLDIASALKADAAVPLDRHAHRSPSVRQQVAGCFAETGLKLDLSGKPLTLKQYNMGRFLDSLRLTPPRVDGFDIEHVAVVEVDARPDNYKHRASLKVTADDDIEAVAESLFGKDHLFSRAACISRVVVSVRYTQHGSDKTKTLNITLSDPNRCNLRSNRDP